MSALTDVFTAIANAIRSKKGVSTTYKPSEMASAISSIPTGITPSGTKYDTYTSNGTYNTDITNYANHSVTVNCAIQKTTLWTNPNPNTSLTNVTITLSERPGNYDALLINWYNSTSSKQLASTIDTRLTSQMSGTGWFSALGGWDTLTQTNGGYLRNLKTSGTSSIIISSAYKLLTSSTVNIDDSYIIPVSIIGLKGLNL